jgi:hypothetical protein
MDQARCDKIGTYLTALAMLATILAALALPAMPASAQGSDPCVDAQSGIVPAGYELVYAPDQGGSRSQVVLGTSGADVLGGGSGNDILCGLGGDDVLEGGSGDDRLDAGSGSNELYGGSGYDILIGMQGDVFESGSGGGEIIANDPGPLVSSVTVTFRVADSSRCYADVSFDGFTPGTLLTGWTIIGANSDGSGGIHHAGFEITFDDTGHYAFTDVSGARGDIYNGVGYYQVQLVDGTPLMTAVPIVC